MQTWSSQLHKGLVDLWLLGHLAQGQSYGYQLGQILFENGGITLSSGTTYRTLAKFRKAGWVRAHRGDSPLGPGRQYYQLTAQGRQRLRTLTLMWRHAMRVTDKALGARSA